MNYQTFTTILKEVIGETNLSKHGENGFKTVVNRKFEIIFEEDPQSGSIILYAPLDITRIKQKESLYRDVLQTHLFGHLTNDAVFAVDPSEENIIVFKILDQIRDSSELEETLKGIVHLLEEWQDKIQKTN